VIFEQVCFKSKMDKDLADNAASEEHSQMKNSDYGGLHFINLVPVTSDAVGPCTAEHDSADNSAEVQQKRLPVVKQEIDNVCYVACYI